MAQFKPGHKKVGGRQKGTPNKATAQLREIVAELLQLQIDRIKSKDLGDDCPLWEGQKLDLKERYDVLIRLLPYVLPRKQNNTIDNENDNE
jgi:hypothetical protein